MENYRYIEKLRIRLKKLPLWESKISIKNIEGGMQNYNHLIQDNNNLYVAKLGGDISHYQIKQYFSLKVSKAAHALGIAPKVVYHEDGIIIFEYIKSKMLTNTEVKKQYIIKKIISLIKLTHLKMGNFIGGPISNFWYFDYIKKSIKILNQYESPYSNLFEKFFEDLKLIEKSTGSHKLVFTHNDLNATNILKENDSERLWLIDWENSGYNFAILDMASLSKNNNFNKDEDRFILNEYFQDFLTLTIEFNFQAFKCAAILKEVLWSMISEIKSRKGFNYTLYTKEKLDFYNKQFNYFKTFNF